MDAAIQEEEPIDQICLVVPIAAGMSADASGIAPRHELEHNMASDGCKQPKMAGW